MVKKLIMVTLLVASMLGAEEKKILPQKITLGTTTKFIAITEQFTESLAQDFAEAVMTSSVDKILVYIDSPGGSVFALNNMIEHMMYSDKKFTCVARYAASAAFMLLQFCDERFILPYGGILMSHDASATLSGKLPKLRNVLDVWQNLIEKIEFKVAARMGMSFDDYKDLIAHDIWMDYSIGKAYNAIDEYAYITCTPDLVKERVTKTVNRCSFFGCQKVKVTVSGCPLLTKTYNEEDEDDE